MCAEGGVGPTHFKTNQKNNKKSSTRPFWPAKPSKPGKPIPHFYTNVRICSNLNQVHWISQGIFIFFDTKLNLGHLGPSFGFHNFYWFAIILTKNLRFPYGNATIWRGAVVKRDKNEIFQDMAQALNHRILITHISASAFGACAGPPDRAFSTPVVWICCNMKLYGLF